MSVLLGQRYELLHQLGKGGMGEVYAARDHLSGDLVALKRVLVEPNFLQFNSRNETAELRITLTREFRTLASLRHPHVISVLDYGFDSQNQPFYTMEYLQDTQPLLRISGTLDDEGKVNLIIQLLQGLDYLHHRGLLHRDLKPANVLVANNSIKIIDFGLAIEPEQAQDPVGTLTFMAPELFEGENASVASDLYAVGIIIYAMFANRYPFDGHKMAQGLIEDILNLRPDFESIPQLLRPILEKLLAKKANNRFSSAHDTIVAISEVTRQAVPKETLAIRESYLQASRFIGRSDELNTLTNALNNAIHDYGSAWLIGGESGVGKSRLLQELRVKALVQGVTVISALGEDGTVAGNMFWANPLRRLLLSVTIDDFEASILKAIVPDISNILKRPVDDAPELSGEAFKLRLELVIVSVFERQQTPVLLILEDIHWALDSLEPLQLLTTVIEHLPLLIVGTYRNDEQPNLPNEIPNAKTIILKRFDNLEVQNICRSMLKQHTVDDEVINLIEKETEGNAFFIVEVIRALAEDAGSLGDIGQVTLPANVFAQGIQSLVIRRLNKIPTWGQKLLQVAAISGRQLSRPLLEQALTDWVEDSSNHSLEEWLALCSDVAVLDVQDEIWRFAHDKLREGVLGDLELSEKHKLHGYVGMLKESIFSENIAPYLADIALHFQQAHNEVKEGHYMYLAGQQAAKQYANADAIRFLSRALELCPATQAEHYFEILKHREQVYNHQSLRDLQRLDLNDMTKIAETVNNQVMLAWAYSRWAEFYEQIDELDQVEIVAQKAIELAHLVDRVDIAGMAHFWWARVLRKRADFGEAQKHNAEMLAIARRLGDRNLETEALRHTGYTAVQAGQFKFAHPYLVEAIEVAEAIGNRRAKSLGQMVLGELILYTPYFHQAMYLFKDALEFSELIGDRWGQTWASLGLLVSYELIGDYWNAMLIGEKTVTLCKQLHDNDKLFEASSFLCEAYQALGDYETARDYANFVLGFAKTNEKFLARMSAMSTLGLIAYEQENYSDSISFFKDAVSVSEQARMNVFIMHSLTYLGHAYWQNGDYARAEEVWDRAVNQVVLEQQNRGIFRGYCGLAMVANRKGQPNEALKYIEPFINYLKESTIKTGSIQIDTYSNTFLILRSLGDVRATYVLEEGYAFLQEMANHIPDHAARERFLQIRTHQRFLDLWEDFHKTKDDTTESPV